MPAVANAPRNWGPEQATGAPDTPDPGDQPTAWASLTPDEHDEWLVLHYPRTVIPAGVRVFESHCPGALRSVALITPDGKEHEVWHGTDPIAPDQKSGVATITFKTNLKVDRIKLRLDSKAVAGWNEIDAVALDDPAGKSQWADRAWASSTYADRIYGAAATDAAPALGEVGAMLPLAPVAVPASQPIALPAVPIAELTALRERVARLEAELAELKARLADLERRREGKR